MSAFLSIQRLLRARIGLDPSSIGLGTVGQVIAHRMARCGVETMDAYERRLRQSKAELEALVEEIVVPETWFFRDRAAFSFLVEQTKARLGRPDQPCCRLLSLPCSTGEEPYSMVMALLDAAVPPGKFNLEAADISRRALQRARRGHYTRHSFRGPELAYRDVFFSPVGSDQFELAETARRQVEFFECNLLEPGSLLRRERYDVVACRNVLIYMSAEARRQVLDTLARVLVSDGLLLVGYAETNLVPADRFAPAAPAGAFAFRKRALFTRANDRVGPRAPLASAQEPQRPATGGQAVARRPGPAPLRTQRAGQRPRLSLPLARHLADVGRVEEAAQWCELHLREHGPSAEALHLLGVVQGALGRPLEAEALLTKAVYLDAHNVEAMIHLAHLASQRQDSAAVARWNRRVQRVLARREAS